MLLVPSDSKPACIHQNDTENGPKDSLCGQPPRLSNLCRDRIGDIETVEMKHRTPIDLLLAVAIKHRGAGVSDGVQRLVGSRL